jgi:hypothetical protein
MHMSLFKVVRSLVAIGGVLTAALAANLTPASAFGILSNASCDSPAVLRAISHRFSIADRNVLQSGLAIEDYFDIHQNRYTPAGETTMISRLFCHGKVAMNDGRTRKIWYMIEAGQGFAGVGGNVEYCISGLDPWHINGAFCRSVR